MQFEHLPQGEGRLDDRVHGVQGGCVNLVDILHGEGQMVVVVTDLHGIGERLLIRRRHDGRVLSRRIGTVILFGRVMEDGVPSLGHPFLASCAIVHRVADNPEGEEVSTGIQRRVDPERVRHVGIAHIVIIHIFIFAEPAPPAVETAFADREFHFLVQLVYVISGGCPVRVVVIEDTLVLMHPLSAVQQRIAGSSGAMGEGLVGTVLETA